jgi:hypothetical protein
VGFIVRTPVRLVWVSQVTGMRRAEAAAPDVRAGRPLT